MDNFIIAKATDVGVTRQVNEDSMTVFDSPNGQVLAVCDGMGGQAAGDVASKLAVNIIENILTDNTFDSPEDAIRRSIVAANQGVLNRTAQNPELAGMGSTCVMMIIKNGRVHCGWVGDSRIYYIANHTIRQISHDQSYVQQLVDSGQITAIQAAVHPQKNEITNCIGLEGMTEPDTIPVPISPEPGSVFLLCSDGLSSVVEEHQIERVVSNSSISLQQRAERLVELANEAGGPDNITVQLVQFGSMEATGATSGTLFETPAGVKTGGKPRSLLSIVISVCVALVVCAGGVFCYVQFIKPNQEQKVEQKVTKKRAIKSPTGSSVSTGNTNGASSPATNSYVLDKKTVNSTATQVQKTVNKRETAAQKIAR
ncbi:MAG: Stp1/IreP family PP2C-type Ser/Thr phosphatase, partial [Muribaculaceae bacterium]